MPWWCNGSVSFLHSDGGGSIPSQGTISYKGTGEEPKALHDDGLRSVLAERWTDVLQRRVYEIFGSDADGRSTLLHSDCTGSTPAVSTNLTKYKCNCPYGEIDKHNRFKHGRFGLQVWILLWVQIR